MPPLDLRHFASSTETIDAAWSTCASVGDLWTPTGHQWGTENGPLEVTNAAGNRGVQKPGKAAVSNPHTAATEKIVADLAYVIGLPVPPVTLVDLGAAASPRCVAVSAWAFDSPVAWAVGEGMLTPAQKLTLLAAVSAMVPFETWIGATDRVNPGNFLIDGSLAPLRGAWIDYAFSLNHVWGGNLVGVTQVAPMYPAVGAIDRGVALAIADLILKVDDRVIESIVNRIPADFMPPAGAANILRNLLARRSQIAAVL